MEFEWETRPLSVTQRTRDWQDTSQAAAGPSSSGGPPSSFSHPLTSRRRSSAANVPPAGPPPSQPIPDLPTFSTSSNGRTSVDIEEDIYSPHVSTGLRNGYSPFSRPAASANLTAVTAFSQRNALGVHNPQFSTPSADNLSDPPPRSILHSASSRALTQHQRLFLIDYCFPPGPAHLQNQGRLRDGGTHNIRTGQGGREA